MKITFALLTACLLIAYPTLLPGAEKTISDREIRVIEKEIQALKQSVLEEKVELRQLQETLLYGALTQTHAFVTLRNLAQGYFQLEKGSFYLNDKLIYKIDPKDAASSEKPIAILDGEVPPGQHTLRMNLEYTITNKGPVTYGSEYRFRVNETRNFDVEQGTTRALEIEVTDRGYFKSKFEDRLVVIFKEATGN